MSRDHGLHKGDYMRQGEQNETKHKANRHTQEDKQKVVTGGDATLVQSIKSLKQRGHIHIVGFLAKPEPGQATGLSNVASLLILPEATIRGVAIGSKVLTQQLDDFLEKHKIEPVVDPKVFEWSKVIDAIAYLESGAHFGKVVIRVD